MPGFLQPWAGSSIGDIFLEKLNMDDALMKKKKIAILFASKELTSPIYTTGSLRGYGISFRRLSRGEVSAIIQVIKTE